VRERLPHARHEVVDCGHVPQLERPAQTHAALARFLHRRGAQRPIADQTADVAPRRAARGR
jgi:hypothetical protein